jgi:tryptophan-rich sensory protein
MKKITILLLFILIPLLIGAGSSVLVTQNQAQTYANLIQPNFAPPSWLFGPVWTFLYICMGVASWLVWKSNNKSKKTALIIYSAQLILNFFWTGIFFGLGQFGWALVELIILWILILINCILFWRIKTWAGILFLPYILWASFAGILNFFIWRLN